MSHWLLGEREVGGKFGGGCGGGFGGRHAGRWMKGVMLRMEWSC